MLSNLYGEKQCFGTAFFDTPGYPAELRQGVRSVSNTKRYRKYEGISFFESDEKPIDLDKSIIESSASALLFCKKILKIA